MSIKNYIFAISAAASLAACSNIAEDERLIFVEHREIEKDPLDSLFVSTVLVEDFTGQKCTWCPFGTRILEEQQALYGSDRVVPVAIHSGNLGFRGTATSVGLMNDLGIYYWNCNGFNSATSQPTAVFNRRIVTDEREAWGASIFAELEHPAQAGMLMAVSCDEAARTAHLQVTCLAKEARSAMLQVWLTENGIQAMQIDNGQTRKDYIHNHVLRDAVNGADGEPVALAATPVTRDYDYEIPAVCVPRNCDLVAFLYDDSGILQTIHMPVVGKSE